MMPDQSAVAADLVFLVESEPGGAAVVFLTVRLCMYYYMVIDNDAGVFESFRQSWHCTKHQASTITMVFCVQLAILLAGSLGRCASDLFSRYRS